MRRVFFLDIDYIRTSLWIDQRSFIYGAIYTYYIVLVLRISMYVY